MPRHARWLAIAAAALIASCGGGDPPAPSPTPSPVVPRGDRVLSIDVTLPESDDFDAAIHLARSVGMQETPFSFNWDELEKRPGVYEAGLLPVLRAYSIATSLPIHLTLSPIDTNNLRLPKDLREKKFDDPLLAQRYRALLRFVLGQLGGVRLRGLSIGNEVDAYLGQDAARWREYRSFVASTAPEARARGLQVGVKAGMGGLLTDAADELSALNQLTDIVLVTYYPIGPTFEVRDPAEVPRDIDALVARYPGKRIALLEAGYPSSPLLGSSNERERQFIVRLFEAWDSHAAQIQTISFFCLTDFPPAVVEELKGYYGLNDDRFGAYLGTLGLRTFPGTGADKEAFGEVRRQAALRGWPTTSP
jgi:hypothetical protein